MQNYRSSIFFFILTLLISGCGSVAYKLPLELTSKEDDGNSGIVILSTRIKEPKSLFNRNRSVALVKHDKKGKLIFTHLFITENALSKSHFSEHHGYVHATNLPVGKYELMVIEVSPRWSGSLTKNPYPNSYLHPVANNSYPLPTFTVKANEYRYLGEIFLHPADKKGRAYSLSSKFERDLSIIKTMYPDLNVDKVEENLLNLSKPSIVVTVD
jgi:hypothetical protein